METHSELAPTTCPLDCPDACGILVERDTAGRFVRLRGNPAHTWSQGHLCGKTMQYGELIAHEDRLRTPLVRKRSGFEEASWDDALALIVQRLEGIAGPDVLALSYGGSMGLVQRKYPYRVMHALGATFHDGGICDAAATAGFECVLGRCLGPDLETIEESDLVVLWGTDVARTVQHLQPRLKRCQERGVPVVAIDVWRTDTLRDVERRGGRAFVIRGGTDAQLALCLARIAFEAAFADHEYLARECLGAPDFELHVRARFGLEETSAITGLSVADILELAQHLGVAQRPFIKTGVGWTRRRNGAMGMRAVCSLAAVLGHGDRVHFESFAHFGLAEESVFRPDLRPEQYPDRPVKHVQLGRELESGRFHAAFVWCHDPAVTLPDSTRFKRGFAREDLFTVVHEHFMTETAELADVVLPATMFVEHDDVYRSYGHRTMHYARRIVDPPPGPRSNVAFFAELARRLSLPREVWGVTESGLCETLLDASRSRLTPDEAARLRAGEPVKLHDREYVGWGTPSGKIELVSEAARQRGQPALADYVPDDAAGDRGAYWLVGAPSVHTHNSTFSHSARHRKRNGIPCVHVNPDDACELGLSAGARVRLKNERAELILPVTLSPEMPRGSVRVDGLPRARDIESLNGLNALTSPELSDLGDGNVMYSARVDLVPA
ncbi:MAG: molybdopterin-dependent oxidoreductase [Planctomycetes bacterium]|nr:molybdopterin-dependent oxidoreductase [Planctomycetota bacterium]